MQAKFTIQYGEFAVADYLAKQMEDVSVFIPSSAQEKGIDLLLYKFHNGVHKVCTVQVKMSRAYYYPNKKYQGTLWLNRFVPQDNADWFIIVGIYAKYPEEIEHTKSTDIKWDTLMLAFTNQEMKKFMEEVRLKKNPEKYDQMFGFGFNGKHEIMQTRGYKEERDMTQYLIENRLDEIRSSFR
ncbi:hypothetical protein [Butyricicoccus sp.]|uniref:hypothetical protein n=1 Tax=Butyricicoccus sp. TaxID=2049021 RepID=UPI003F15EF2A